MDRAAILACPITVVGVVMYAAPPNQVSEETPPREGDRIGRCRCWVQNRKSRLVLMWSALPPKPERALGVRTDSDGFEGLAEIGRLLLVEICRIPKVVEFVLGESRRRNGHSAAVDRMRKRITILMRSRLRLALARVQYIHAIQAARRA